MTTYTASVTSAGAPAEVLTPRWSYFTVENLDTSNGVWVSTDGQTTAAVNTDNCFFIPASEAMILANMTPLWTQSATVIQTGTMTGASPGHGTPYEMQPTGTSLYGGKANPGVVISAISSISGNPNIVISAAG